MSCQRFETEFRISRSQWDFKDLHLKSSTAIQQRDGGASLFDWWLSLIPQKNIQLMVSFQFAVVRPKPKRLIQETEYSTLLSSTPSSWVTFSFSSKFSRHTSFFACSMSPPLSHFLVLSCSRTWVARLKGLPGAKEEELDVCHSAGVRDHSNRSPWVQLQIKTLRWETA